MPISITPINNGDAVNATPIDNNYDTIVSAINSFDGSNIQAGTIPNTALLENPDNIRNEILNDYVVSGLTTATSVNLTSSVASGLAYINGKRVEKLSSTPKTFDANQVTYIDINDEGTITYTTSTSVTADSIRLSKVTTDADNITAVTDMRDISPVSAGLITTAALKDDSVTTDKMALTVSPGLPSSISNTGIYRFGNFKIETGSLAIPNGTTGWQQYNVTFKEVWTGAPMVILQNTGVNGAVETDNTSVSNILAIYNDIFVFRAYHSSVNYGHQISFLAIGPA
jgi:hypothetical protein